MTGGRYLGPSRTSMPCRDSASSLLSCSHPNRYAVIPMSVSSIGRPIGHPAMVGGGNVPKGPKHGHNGDRKIGWATDQSLKPDDKQPRGQELALMPARRPTAVMTEAGVNGTQGACGCGGLMFI